MGSKVPFAGVQIYLVPVLCHGTNKSSHYSFLFFHHIYKLVEQVG